MEKVPLETRLEIVAQIADALQAEHDSKVIHVIHRDVRPSNILAGTDPNSTTSWDSSEKWTCWLFGNSTAFPGL